MFLNIQQNIENGAEQYMLQSHLIYWSAGSLTRVPPVMAKKIKKPCVSKISLLGSNTLIKNYCPTYIE